MTRRFAVCLFGGLAGPPLLLLLLLLNTARYGDAACSGTILTKEVNETTTAGWVIETLDATYQQSSSPGIDPVYACYFEVSGGTLRLKKQFDLENFTSCVDGTTVPMATILSAVTLTIPCSGTSDTVTFLIRLVDINELPPMFVPNTFRVNVSEAAAVGTLVIQLNSYVVDKDKSRQTTFNFLIASGSQSDFAMNDGVTSGIVRIQRALDYDAGTRQYVMNISASDLITEPASLPLPLTGFASLTIDVTDFDDVNPYFTQSSYSLYFMENDTSYVNKPLSTTPPLEARDGDSGINQTINYAMESAMWSGSNGSYIGSIAFLSVNRTTGQLTVLSLIDREALPGNVLLVQIKAYQTDKPDTRVATTLVIVTVGDKNDNAPVMGSALYNVSIAENSLAGSYVTTLKAADADMGQNATFAFALNDTSGAFQVDSISGQVTVANSLLLDRETRANLVMMVWAQEYATPERFSSERSLLIVNLIDLNDNSPVFEPPNSSYAFVVSADAPVGATVGSVVASDADQGENGVVRFSVSWSDGSSGTLFQLDPVTGNLTTRASLAGVPGSVYVMQVVAEDQATPVSTRRQSRAIVQITVSTAATTAAPSTTGGSSSTSGTSTSSASAPATTAVASTTTTASSSLSSSSTRLPYSTTAAPNAAPVADSGVQIALIVVCALLLLAVIALVAMLIWCWSFRQPRSLKAELIDVPASPAAVNGGTTLRPQSGQMAVEEAAAEMAEAPKATAALAANSIESAYGLHPMTQTGDDMSLPRRDGLASAGIASLFLSLSPRHSPPPSLTATVTAGPNSPSRDSIGSTFDWLGDRSSQPASQAAAGSHNYWCLPATVTVNTAL